MHPHETKIYISLLIGVSVLFVLVVFFIVTIIRYHRKRLAFHQENLQAEFNQLDKERERIACDLHDDLGSSLSFIKIRLQCLKNMTAENDLIVQNSEHHIDEAMKKLRRISFNMMPKTLQQQGLDEALRELIAVMTDPVNITVDYQCEVDSCDQEKAIHIYRISQEILNNIVKHSKATSVNFTIVKIKNKIELRIKDNGIGFNKNILKTMPRHLGLHNISARADLLKANVYLTTSIHNGVDYLIEIPIL